MPCNSDYMEPGGNEIHFSRVACLLDELDGKSLNKMHWNGHHPAVYNKGINGDSLVSELCERLQSVDIKEYSLEMQIWWRDHQAADKARIEHEIARAKTEKEKQEALDKLTDHEKNLLGLK